MLEARTCPLMGELVNKHCASCKGSRNKLREEAAKKSPNYHEPSEREIRVREHIRKKRAERVAKASKPCRVDVILSGPNNKVISGHTASFNSLKEYEDIKERFITKHMDKMVQNFYQDANQPKRQEPKNANSVQSSLDYLQDTIKDIDGKPGKNVPCVVDKEEAVSDSFSDRVSKRMDEAKKHNEELPAVITDILGMLTHELEKLQNFKNSKKKDGIEVIKMPHGLVIKGSGEPDIEEILGILGKFIDENLEDEDF